MTSPASIIGPPAQKRDRYGPKSNADWARTLTLVFETLEAGALTHKTAILNVGKTSFLRQFRSLSLSLLFPLGRLKLLPLILIHHFSFFPSKENPFSFFLHSFHFLNPENMEVVFYKTPKATK